MTKAYLINLDRSQGRLDFMTQKFNSLGLVVERVPAVDGLAIDLAPYADSGLTQGEVGCFLSHRVIWEKLVSSDDDHALVLEDDVRLSADLPELLANLSWIPASAGVVKLDMAGGRIGVAKSAYDAPRGRKLFLLRTMHDGGAGYIVSRAYAAKLIKESATLREAVDVFMFGVGAVAKDDGRIWQMVPAAVAQEKRFNTNLQPELASLIQPKRRKKPWLKQLGRNLEKPVRILVKAVRRQYRSATQDIRYLQMTFR